MLGHSQPATTARYAHLADDPVRAASEAVGRYIASAMDGMERRGRGLRKVTRSTHTSITDRARPVLRQNVLRSDHFSAVQLLAASRTRWIFGELYKSPNPIDVTERSQLWICTVRSNAKAVGAVSLYEQLMNYITKRMCRFDAPNG